MKLHRIHYRICHKGKHTPKLHLRVMIWFFRLCCQQRFRLWRHFVITGAQCIRAGHAPLPPIISSDSITCSAIEREFLRLKKNPKDIYVLLQSGSNLEFGSVILILCDWSQQKLCNLSYIKWTEHCSV